MESGSRLGQHYCSITILLNMTHRGVENEPLMSEKLISTSEVVHHNKSTIAIIDKY